MSSTLPRSPCDELTLPISRSASVPRSLTQFRVELDCPRAVRFGPRFVALFAVEPASVLVGVTLGFVNQAAVAVGGQEARPLFQILRIDLDGLAGNFDRLVQIGKGPG